MGRDKALIEVAGRPLAVIAADALSGAGASEVFAVGGDADALAALGLRTVPDRWPAEGPLGAVVTALDVAAFDVVVVLACDLPNVTSEAVGAVAAAVGDASGAVAVAGGRDQWLLGAWRRTALPALRAAFGAGERALWRAASALDVVRVAMRDESWARDADRPADLFGDDIQG
jgi:molybdopterin-guanine dinucleotide biosynthesis protein A